MTASKAYAKGFVSDVRTSNEEERTIEPSEPRRVGNKSDLRDDVTSVEKHDQDSQSYEPKSVVKSSQPSGKHPIQLSHGVNTQVDKDEVNEELPTRSTQLCQEVDHQGEHCRLQENQGDVENRSSDDNGGGTVESQISMTHDYRTTLQCNE
jgi:hypothetical protein